MNRNNLQMWKRAAAVIVCAGLFLIFAPSGIFEQAELIAATERQAASPIVLNDIQGATWQLEDYRGRIVMINYFATWCAPCIAEAPALNNIAAEYRAAGLETFGISLDEPDVDLSLFAARHRVPYRIARHAETQNMTLVQSAIPVTLLIDKQNRVALRHVGQINEQAMRENIQRLLRE